MFLFHDINGRNYVLKSHDHLLILKDLGQVTSSRPRNTAYICARYEKSDDKSQMSSRQIARCR